MRILVACLGFALQACAVPVAVTSSQICAVQFIGQSDQGVTMMRFKCEPEGRP